MTALETPAMGRYEAWADCVAEFLDAYPHGSGLPEVGPVDAGPEAYAAAVTQAETYRDESLVLPAGRLHTEYLWVSEGEDIIGFVRFTFSLNGLLLEKFGHIGYSIRPSRRRQGHASRALALTLERASARGLARVLLTCDDTNVASARTIESGGGVLEDVRHGRRRYWINLPPATGGGGHAGPH